MNKLQAFAQKYGKKGPACTLCGLPEIKEIEQSRQNGISYSMIAKCLSAPKPDGYGYAHVTFAKVAHHMREHAKI